MNRLLIPCSLLFGAASLLAQCPEISLGLALGSGDEVVFPIRPIGFAFPLGGTTYTDVHVTTNGHMYLSNAGVPPPGTADFTATVPEFVNGSPRVAPLWNDLNMLVANNGIVYINSTPSRCTVTWKNAVNYGAPAGSPTFDIQAQLFPSGEVRFFYSPATNNNSTTAAWAVGITGVTPGLGAPTPPPSNLLAGGTTPDDTIYQEFATPLTFTLANNALLLAPTSPGWVFTPLGPPPASGCANLLNYGTGCGGSVRAFYELMPPGGFDLNGVTMSMIRTASGYIVLDAIPGTLVPPSPLAVVVADADDTTQTVALSAPMPVAGGTTSAISICSNGRITLSALNNGNTWTPTVATFLGWAQTELCAVWHDYNPVISGSGKIRFEEVGGIAYVTWDGVYSFGTSVPDTFQVQFNVATGDIKVIYQNISNVGNGYLVGYKVGGTLPDPGPTDLSSALGATFPVSDLGPLALAGVGSPVVGNLSFGLRVSNVPPLLPVAFIGFGSVVVNPGVPLASIGMPGCEAYTNLDLGLFATGLVTGGAGVANLPIPNNPALVGAVLSSQGVALSLDTPLNLISSNGTRIGLGL